MSPVLALVVTNIIWGAAAPIFKFSLQNIPPFTLAVIRFIGPALLLAPFALRHWKDMTAKQWFLVCLGAFFALNVNIGFFFLALGKTESINAPVIGSAQPIFLFFLSVFLLKERPRVWVFWGILTAFCGVLIIIFSPFLHNGAYEPSVRTEEMIGNLYLVIATAGAVANTLIFKKVFREISVLQGTFISFLFSGILFLPIMMRELEQWSFAQLTVPGWVGIGFGVFLSSLVAYGLYNYGIAHMRAQEVGVFSYIDPVIAVIIAIPLIGEHPTPYFFIGTAFVFVGILIAERRLHWHPLGSWRRYTASNRQYNCST